MDIREEKCEDGLEEFLLEFLEDRKNECITLSTASLVENESEIREICHKWQGYSRPYGFFTLESLAVELRDAVVTKDEDSFVEIKNRIKNYLEEKEKLLKS